MRWGMARREDRSLDRAVGLHAAPGVADTDPDALQDVVQRWASPRDLERSVANPSRQGGGGGGSTRARRPPPASGFAAPIEMRPTAPTS